MNRIEDCCVCDGKGEYEEDREVGSEFVECLACKGTGKVVLR